MLRIFTQTQRYRIVVIAVLLTGLLSLAFAQGTPPAAPAPGTTLVDLLQLQGDAIRTLPRLPRVGAWGLVPGTPVAGEGNFGIQIDKPRQAVIYPTTTLLLPAAGTIEFSVKLPANHDAANAQPRVLLDSWPATGNSRIQVVLAANKLALHWTDDANATKSSEGTVNWAARSVHKIAVLWDAADAALYVDGVELAKIEAPKLFTREPLGIVLGSNRELTAPCGLAVSSLRLSTAKEPVTPANIMRIGDNIPNEELTLKMAQGYDRSLYPLLEHLKKANLLEVPFAYALAYADIGDTARAMQAVTPIANDAKHPLYLQAVFLRADMLADSKDFVGAYDQLQVLATSPDRTISIRAQVKQAEGLYEQGMKAEAIRLIGEIIARYTDLPDINDAYLVVGMEKFKSGSFQDAFRAFNFIGIPGAPPRQSVQIGLPFEIKVADPDLNVRIADIGLPITVIADSGDEEEVMLKPAFSRGVYLGSVETALGQPKKGDGILQVRGNDKIKLQYTDRLSAEGADIKRVVALDLATDATLIALAQSALPVYREALEYQKKNILDERWEIVGTLPKTASKFFRNTHDGALFKKGMRFDMSFISRVKAGQPFYAELTDPDEDITDQPDTVQLELTTGGGQKQTVTLTETGPHTGVFTALVKTTLEGQPKDGALEVKKNDTITARYLDGKPAAGTRDPAHVSRMVIQMTTDGKIVCEREIADPTNEDKNHTVMVQAVRVPNGSQVFIALEDRDLDVTEGKDKVKVNLKADSGGTLELILNETDDVSGTFLGSFRVLTAGATVDPKLPVLPILTVQAGDMVNASYVDEENMKNEPTPRVSAFRVNIAEKARIIISRQIVELPPAPEGKTLTAPPPPKIRWEDTNVLVPGSLYRVTLVDGDVVPMRSAEQWTKVMLKSANGATVDVPLLGSLIGGRQETDKEPNPLGEYTNVFTGQFFARLGDTGSPLRAYFSQTGEGSLSLIDMRDDEEVSSTSLWSVPAINVQGRDAVTVVYAEPNPAATITVGMRVAGDGTMEVLNAKGNPLESLKPGMSFDLQVSDPNGDITAKRDVLKATLTSSANDKLEVTMTETDLHSGVFSGLVPTVYNKTAVPTNATLEVPFDGKITITYQDTETIAGTVQARTATLTTRPLADAEGQLLTKVYDNPKFEVETLVRLGESLYAVGAAELETQKKPTDGSGRTNAKLQESARLLQQVVERFPTSQYVVESLFLTGKIRREEKHKDAEKLFTRVIEEYPDSDFVPQALYQLVLLYYEQNDIDKATEACMRLVYGFPKNPLVVDAALRIAEYYYGVKKDYLGAAFIYKRLIERFPDNPKIDLVTYRMATAYYRAGLAGEASGLVFAIRYYLEFADQYKDHELADDALYWAANAYLKQNNARKAFTMLTKELITYPDGDMKAYATRLRDKIKDDYPNIQAESF
ncbi:MAG: tetratricopeptide repeat protein [Armatimonadota bacterium]